MTCLIASLFGVAMWCHDLSDCSTIWSSHVMPWLVWLQWCSEHHRESLCVLPWLRPTRQHKQPCPVRHAPGAFRCQPWPISFACRLTPPQLRRNVEVGWFSPKLEQGHNLLECGQCVLLQTWNVDSACIISKLVCSFSENRSKPGMITKWGTAELCKQTSVT